MEIGQVIGTTSLRTFRFVIKEGAEKHVKRDEFVSVRESVTGREILGIVKDIVTSNELLPDEFGRDMRLGDIILNEGEYPVPIVKILGYEGENGLEIPRYGIKPGAVVELTNDETLRRILEQDAAKSAYIGTISTRASIPVSLSLNDLISRHCAVLAMTGAGKSYTVGVIIEEIMKKHGSIVVFDPHGEYRGMAVNDSDSCIYSIEGDNRIKIAVRSLHTGDFANLIPDLTDPQRDLLDELLNMISRFYEEYDLSVLTKVLSELYDVKKASDKTDGQFPSDILSSIARKVGLATIGALMRRVGRLENMGLFDAKGMPLEAIIRRNQLTIMDLSEADERLSETVVVAMCRRIFNARKSHEKKGGSSVPTFLIVEEAHNFAPRGVEDRVVMSRAILRKIAREGRKFGVGLCIVSQRPNKLDADVLSQCNTQIIMKIVNPSDQEYIRQSVETVTEDIVRDLPSLSRGEAIVVGSAIRMPVPVKIRMRETTVGGEDIDIVGAWNSD
ncbi:MAG: hypothetical protein MSIBF_05695 [Candidatus Altiarchaeales archaeon IMC4]|nr:MAG: hypothetical protein MSIBF_05695 [Candidatus Altiarchaeales archaeon IMC4]